MTKEPHEEGKASVAPLKNWTTASPLELAAVVMWNVRPGLFFLQRNLIWVKGRTFLSSFMAVVVRKTCFLLIPRYEFFTGRRDGGVELLNTSLWDEKPTTWNHTRFRFVMSANKPAIPIVTARNAKLIGLYQFKKNSREFSKFSSKITYLHPLTNCNIEVFEKFA